VKPLSREVWALFSTVTQQAATALFANPALMPYVHVLLLALYTAIQKFLY